MEYYVKTICTKTYLFVQQHYLVTVMISSMIHLNKRKKDYKVLESEVKLIYSSTGSIVISIDFFLLLSPTC